MGESWGPEEPGRPICEGSTRMSRRLIGWALVIGFGVLNGYTTFKPAFEELELEKLKKQERDAADLGPNMIEVPAQKMESGVVAQAVKSDRSQSING